MSPQEIGLIASTLGLIKEIGGGGIIGILLVVVTGPWLLAVALSVIANRRFKAAVEMYKSNYTVVEEYEKLCGMQGSREEALRGIIHLNTQAMTRLADKLEGSGK